MADSLEYLHGGNTAQVALQYSYLPSWISFLVDISKAEEAGEALVTAVTERALEIPEAERPEVFLFGESLGSFGTESAFDDPEDLLASSDGAMLVGPTFVNPIREDLTDERDEGSPEWQPIVEDGRRVRFAQFPDDLDEPPGEWDDPRIVYLQNASDPITWFSPDLLLEPPGWLDDPRGTDVSEDMFWMPVVTFWQVAADLAVAGNVPAGHGHRYGANVVDAWVALSAPEGWTEQDTEELRALIALENEIRTSE
ncbi:MAG: alpha/beta-hydrolase family protein [Actinomycetota bacterium]